MVDETVDILTLNKTLIIPGLKEQLKEKDQLHYSDTSTLISHICHYVLDDRSLMSIAKAHAGLLSVASLKEMLNERKTDHCQICLEGFDAVDEFTGIILPSMIVSCCGRRAHINCFEKCKSCPNCRALWTPLQISNYVVSHRFADAFAYMTWIDWRERIEKMLLSEPARAIVPLIRALRSEFEDSVKEYAINKLIGLTTEMAYTDRMVNNGVVEPLLHLMHGGFAVQKVAISLLIRLSTIDASFVEERDVIAATEIQNAQLTPARATAIVIDRENWLRMRAEEDGYTYPAGLPLGFSSWVELDNYAMSVAQGITDPSWEVREAAVYRISMLGPAMVSNQSSLLCHTIMDRNENSNVRRAACIVIGTMSAEDINYCVEAVLNEVLEDEHGERGESDVIRSLLLNVFARLDAINLVCYVDNIVHWLCRGNIASVQSAAMHVLSKLPTFASLVYTEAIRMCAAELQQYNTDTAVQMLQDEDAGVRSMALRILCELEPEVLEQYAGAVENMMQDRDASVRRMALRAADIIAEI